MKAVGEPGWIVTHRPASSVPKKVLPLSALIMNFPMVKNKNPSLLNFNQVKILFGKVSFFFFCRYNNDFICYIIVKLCFQFGHLLQNILCQVHYSEVSGLSNVEWDAIGITSNFMTHW